MEARDESVAQTMERSEIGTPAVAEDLIQVIAARRKHIRDEAECVHCGATLADCKAERGKDPTAPPWFGCCAHGLDLEPCSHRPSIVALNDLLDEVTTGHVRTVAEMIVAQPPATLKNYFGQRTWWRNRAGEFLKIDEMHPGHRYNSAAMLLRNNPDAREIVRVTALYRELTDGLVIQGDGTEPWQKTGRDPVTGESREVPPPMTRAYRLPACGCSGEAHP